MTTLRGLCSVALCLGLGCAERERATDFVAARPRDAAPRALRLAASDRYLVLMRGERGMPSGAARP